MNARNVVPPERRVLITRPMNGDVRPCRACGSRSEFHERHRLNGYVVPAWVCDTPGCTGEIVRLTAIGAVASSQEVIREARAVQARARRTTMKSKAAVQRSVKRIQDSDDQLQRKRRTT